MDELLRFLCELDDREIYCRLNKVRESIMVEIAMPGERWEVEFFADGSVEVEKFVSDGEICGKAELAALFERFSD